MGVYVTDGEMNYAIYYHSFYGFRENAWGGAFRFEGRLQWQDGKGWRWTR